MWAFLCLVILYYIKFFVASQPNINDYLLKNTEPLKKIKRVTHKLENNNIKNYVDFSFVSKNDDKGKDPSSEKNKKIKPKKNEDKLDKNTKNGNNKRAENGLEGGDDDNEDDDNEDDDNEDDDNEDDDRNEKNEKRAKKGDKDKSEGKAKNVNKKKGSADDEDEDNGDEDDDDDDEENEPAAEKNKKNDSKKKEQHNVNPNAADNEKDKKTKKKDYKNDQLGSGIPEKLNHENQSNKDGNRQEQNYYQQSANDLALGQTQNPNINNGTKTGTENNNHHNTDEKSNEDINLPEDIKKEFVKLLRKVVDINRNNLTKKINKHEEPKSDKHDHKSDSNEPLSFYKTALKHIQKYMIYYAIGAVVISVFALFMQCSD